MAERRPLVLIDGTPRELPSGDSLPLASGAEIGQSLVWNGTQWSPGFASLPPEQLAVISDLEALALAGL